ncbi:hypothetical protein [Actinoplanes sp. URMC 104]|uniref:hypothetical protein n=1 Tax=Actinoplanes sp. URMC 104 TaxID=3423409 RepID=UPI003F1CB376
MIASLAAVLALTPALAPGLAPAPLAPAPTDVTLAWTADPGATGFEVTWKETGDFRNLVNLVYANGVDSGHLNQFVEAGQPNRVRIPNELDPSDWRIRVAIIDADGTVLSEPGFSAEFDTDLGPYLAITSAVPQVDGSVRFAWKLEPYTDSNPGDPLDRPAVVPPYQPVVRPVPGDDVVPLGPPVRGAGSLVVRGRTAPLIVGVIMRRNEWSLSDEAFAEINGSRVTADLPASATTGGRLTVTGKAVQVGHVCEPGFCHIESGEYPNRNRELKLQARAGAGAPWQTVATTKTGADGTYTVSTAFAGTRDYRVIALPVAWVRAKQGLTYAESAAGTVRGVPGPATGGGDGGTDDGGQGGGLPITGPPVMWIALAGGLLLAGGVLLRRRAS